MEGADQEGVLARYPRHSPLVGLAAIFVATLIGAACNPLGEDWKLEHLSADYEHHGSTLQVEPGDEFSVELRANGMYPEIPWRIRNIDPAVVELIDERHSTEARAPGDYEGGEGSPKPWGFIGETGFDFVGGEEGESELIFELAAQDELIDEYTVTVAVMDDACEVDESVVGIVTPMRCERKSPDEGPVGLTYNDYGWGV